MAQGERVMEGNSDRARLRFVDDRKRVCCLAEVRGQPLVVVLAPEPQVKEARLDLVLRRLGGAVLDLGGGELWLREVDDSARSLIAPGRFAAAALAQIRAMAAPNQLTLLVFDETARVCWRWRSLRPTTLADVLRWAPAGLPPGLALPLTARRAHLIDALSATISLAGSSRGPAPDLESPAPALNAQLPGTGVESGPPPNAARWW